MHSRYFEDINSMSCDTVIPNIICNSKALLTKQTNGGVFLFLISHFFPVIFILTSTIYKINKMGNRAVDKTWVAPDQLNPCKPFPDLLSFSEIEELIQSDSIPVLLMPGKQSYYTCGWYYPLWPQVKWFQPHKAQVFQLCHGIMWYWQYVDLRTVLESL